MIWLAGQDWTSAIIFPLLPILQPPSSALSLFTLQTTTFFNNKTPFPSSTRSLITKPFIPPSTIPSAHASPNFERRPFLPLVQLLRVTITASSLKTTRIKFRASKPSYPSLVEHRSTCYRSVSSALYLLIVAPRS